MADDAAKIEISATSSKLNAGLRIAAQQVKKFAAEVHSVVGKAGSAAMKIAGKAGGGAIFSVANRGMDFIASQAGEVKTFEESLVRLQIAGDLAADKVDDVRQSARQVSSALGISSQKLVEGAQSYVDLTGDVAGATSSMMTFGRIAQASGAEVSEVATAAAAFKGAGVPLERMEATFSGLIQQGKAGAVSLKDFAGELSKLMPRWAKLTGGGTATGIAEMGATFQIARQGFKGASEAATGLEAMLGGLMGNQFARTGIKIWNTDPKTGERSLKSMSEILDAIGKSELAKDPKLLRDALGSKEAEQAVNMLLKARQHTAGQVSEFDKLVTAGSNATAVQKDLDTYLGSSSGKMGTAWERVKNAIAEAMTPERIATFVEIVEAAASAIGKVIDGLSEIKDRLTGKAAITENPFESKATDEENDSSGIMKFASLGVGGGLDSSVRQANAIVTNAAMQGAAGDKDAPAFLKQREANRKGFADELEKIEAAGDRKKRIRAAVEAMFSGDALVDKQAGIHGTDKEGRKTAGQRYLARVGAKSEEIDKITEELKATAFANKAAEVFAAKIQTLGPMKAILQVDGQAVATAQKKAIGPRRNP